MKKKLLITSLMLGSITNLPAFVGTHDVTNFFRPSDATVKLPYVGEHKWQFGSRFEYATTSSSRTPCSKKSNVLQIYDNYQSSLAMIENPLPTVNAQLVTSSGGSIPLFLQTIQRDGMRGTQLTTGTFSGWDWTIFGSRGFVFDKIPGTFSLSTHFPIRHQEIGSLSITDRTNTDRTQATAPQDILVKQLVTDNLIQNVKQWGGLDLSPWKKTGIGDILVMFAWDGQFPQNKENLKEVEIGAKIGLSIPSGAAKNIDQAFSMPMGNDGAWGMPVGLSLGLNFIHHVKAGLDADFMVLFDNTSMRRLKTTTLQTEFLLLNKGRVLKEYGLTWQFHLYLQAYHFPHGFSASFAYDYIKHDDDIMTPKSNDFNFAIVNSAGSLQEWQAHNLLFKINYDFCESSPSAMPQLEIFYKLPVAGKNIINSSTVGCQMAVSF